LHTGNSPVMNRVLEAQFRRGDGVLRIAEQRLFSVNTSKGFRLSAISRDITENKCAEKQIQRQLQHLSTLHTIDSAITSYLDLPLILNLFLEQVTTQLRVDAAAVLLLRESTRTLDYAAGRGFRTHALQHTHLRLGEGFAGQVALDRRALNVTDLAADQKIFAQSPLLAGEDFSAYFGAPLIAKGQVKGVLEIFNRRPLDLDEESKAFLETLTTQAAIAVENMALFVDLQRSNAELALAYDTTLEGWSRALDLRDRETEGHTERVTETAVRLARAMGVGEAELVHVRRGGLLHDIGKMGISDSILLKPGPLTQEEWVTMRMHPEFAYRLLSPITYLRPALEIPYCHHEKWDGTGYPRGLKGEEIPLVARIFAVVDVWDALLTDRPYRAAWPVNQVREYIRSEAGKHFDPKVVQLFLNTVSDE
jgi:HD-GYP domain-containing protein (c-di-GMP phosphodiesterase class II)